MFYILACYVRQQEENFPTNYRYPAELHYIRKVYTKAEGIYERHQTLTKALIKLGANPELAEENACRIEHVVSDEMMEVFRSYIKE